MIFKLKMFFYIKRIKINFSDVDKQKFDVFFCIDKKWYFHNRTPNQILRFNKPNCNTIDYYLMDGSL